MSQFIPTRDLARGKWRGILIELGIPDTALTGKHVPCPVCNTAKKHFRFDNKGGYGSWICTCGAGDGIDLALKVTGEEFKVVANRIDAMLGAIPTEEIKPTIDADEVRRRIRRVVRECRPAEQGDLLHRYLKERGLGAIAVPPALRFAASLNDGEGALRPCMVASIRGQDGHRVCLHRTFLTPDGTKKAEMAAPRKLMPGSLPKGVSVQLAEFEPGMPLGIAEGIETALSAMLLFEFPVWAALDAGKLQTWCPPEGCTEVVVFGDNDESFTGQNAAYALARRLRNAGLSVRVEIPERSGWDWNDVLLERQRHDRAEASVPQKVEGTTASKKAPVTPPGAGSVPDQEP